MFLDMLGGLIHCWINQIIPRVPYTCSTKITGLPCSGPPPPPRSTSSAPSSPWTHRWGQGTGRWARCVLAWCSGNQYPLAPCIEVILIVSRTTLTHLTLKKNSFLSPGIIYVEGIPGPVPQLSGNKLSL